MSESASLSVCVCGLVQYGSAVVSVHFILFILLFLPAARLVFLSSRRPIKLDVWSSLWCAALSPSIRLSHPRFVSALCFLSNDGNVF